MTALLGIDPGPYSFRQLAWMRQAKGLDDWEKLLAHAEFIVNSQPYFGKGKPPVKRLQHLNPYLDDQEKRQTPERSEGIPIRGEQGREILKAFATSKEVSA